MKTLSRKPLGSHNHLSLVICNRCGHRLTRCPEGFAQMAEHVGKCQPDLAERAARQR